MLKKLQKRNSEGFTIIEVMIVLAIAALILLIVLLAVPALQRNSRNTQRKNDVSQIAGSINDYVSNNNGAQPSNLATLTTAIQDARLGYYTAPHVYFGSNAAIVAGVTPGNGAGNATTLTTEDVIFYNATTCNGNTPTTANASARGWTLQYAVESGNAPTMQCVSS